MDDSSSESAVLDRILDPLTAVFTPELARKIADLRADAFTQDVVDGLGDKANQGTLSPSEHRRYESYVRAGTLIAILQAKARAFLAEQNSN